DGIRDRNVTGVQTCALPISKIRERRRMNIGTEGRALLQKQHALVLELAADQQELRARLKQFQAEHNLKNPIDTARYMGLDNKAEIGRASCRERVKIAEKMGA